MDNFYRDNRGIRTIEYEIDHTNSDYDYEMERLRKEDYNDRMRRLYR